MLLGPGSCFGEKAIIEDTVRAASIVTLDSVVLLSLDKTVFLELLSRGHAMQNVYHQTMGYPSDDDILSLFSALSQPYAKPSGKGASDHDGGASPARSTSPVRGNNVSESGALAGLIGKQMGARASEVELLNEAMEDAYTDQPAYDINAKRGGGTPGGDGDDDGRARDGAGDYAGGDLFGGGGGSGAPGSRGRGGRARDHQGSWDASRRTQVKSGRRTSLGRAFQKARAEGQSTVVPVRRGMGSERRTLVKVGQLRARP